MSEPQPYAVIVLKGQQFRVSPGEKIRVNRLEGSPGEQITVSEVLMVGQCSDGTTQGTPTIGTPVLNGASVSAKIMSHGKAKKIIAFKKKRRKGYTKKQGHRQQFTELLVENITF